MSKLQHIGGMTKEKKIIVNNYDNKTNVVASY